MESIKKKFNKKIPFVLNEGLLEEINECVEENKELFNSRSHFLRCAAIEMMREEKNGGFRKV